MRADADTSLIHRFARVAVALAFVTVAGGATAASAHPPAADSGGPGGAVGDEVAEMLRGDYSPIAVSDEPAVTATSSETTIAGMLRGEYSPIESSSEVAVVVPSSDLTVAEMLRGDLSPIA